MNETGSDNVATWIRDENGNFSLRGVASADEIVDFAATILESRIRRGAPLTGSEETVRYLLCRLGGRDHAVFGCLFLDTRHRVISFEELFNGTIDGVVVHPREVVKEAIERNAAAVILAQNRPSGVAEPNQGDRTNTRRIQQACALVDIQVVDHIVVAGTEAVSFAERGLL